VITRVGDGPATVLAFDFGLRRIGVAIGNTLTRIAQPLATIDPPERNARFSSIATLVDQWQPARLVVGLPTHADGTPHAMTAAARSFAAELGTRHGLPVDLVDERWTSEVAKDELAAAGRGGRAGRLLRDEKAAQIILQAWFNDADDSRGTA
jgi:putative Holliday junction resolvase